MREKQITQPVYSTFIFLWFSCLSVGIWFPAEMAMAENVTTIPIEVNVGVVLDMDKWIGRMGLSCISMALSDFYTSHGYYTTRLVLHTRDSEDDIVGAAAAALDLLKNGEVRAILGPVTSMQADFVIELGTKAKVPIISFSATSSSLASIRSQYFFRAALNDSSQVKAISAIIQAYGWREVVPIYVDNEFGAGIIPFLADALQEIDTTIPYRSVISSSPSDYQIVAELYKLMTMQTRVFIVNMDHSLASRLFTRAKELGMMEEGYIWIITDEVTNWLSFLDSTVIDSMQGVLGIKPYVPRTGELQNFITRWRSKFQQENPTIINPDLNVFGLWAYDAATALARAIEEVGLANVNIRSGFQKENNMTGNETTDLESVGFLEIGPELAQALLNTTFIGLAGDFRLIDGQLQSSAYEIVNVFGNGQKLVGFWTAESGISRDLKVTSMMTAEYSTTKANLGTIIWPGDTTSPPKGWVIPTNGTKMRIGIPVKDGFNEFVKITQNPDSNATIVTGYCIDVFEAVRQSLPYALPCEYIPFVTPDGQSAGTYDDLVYEVYLGNFDAVVGDTTIIAIRSQDVDFTLPYTESGVTMVVPITDSTRTTAWVFLKPLTWELWLTTFCSFVFIAFVVWVLEHRINEGFRGPLSHQVGTVFWFSFSTMVFAHQEKLFSNLARFVIIIWCFVILILTQSYTASLTSMLTVQQLQPTVTDVNELVQKRAYVGYQKDSFVEGFLKRMNFEESKLIAYSSPDELDALFAKGSGNDGIAAAFDEIPYMKLFLAKYGSKYSIVGPSYKTDGFGFVFPIGSPLLHEVSKAVLYVTEGDAMVEIEKKWFRPTSWQDSSGSNSLSTSANSLGLGSFWGLFLIAGVASFSSLLIATVVFVHKNRRVLRHLDPRESIWRKIKVLGRHFDKKDMSSHTFRKSETTSSHTFRNTEAQDNINGVEVTPHNVANSTPRHSISSLHGAPSAVASCPPSPSTYSNHTDGNFVPFEVTPPSCEDQTGDTHLQNGRPIAPQVAPTQVTDVANTDENASMGLSG